MTATSTGIYIARETLDTFAPKLKADLLAALFNTTSLSVIEATETPEASTDIGASPDKIVIEDDEDIVDFTPTLARRFIRGCSKKTTSAITAMVSGPIPEFKISAVGKALSVPVAELSGVWAGITRRTRTVMDEDGVYLIRWLPDAVFGPQDEYVDQTGAFTEMTYRSLRKVLLDV